MGVRREPRCKLARRALAPDAGMVTAEAAVVLPVLVVVALLATAGVQVAIAQTRCLEAAALIARMSARGDGSTAVAAVVHSSAPAGSHWATRRDGETVAATVTAHVQVPLVGVALPDFVVTESAVAAVEPGASS